MNEVEWKRHELTADVAGTQDGGGHYQDEYK